MKRGQIEIPRNISVICFDWDGTVVDSVGPKLRQNQAIAHEFGNQLTLDEVRRHWAESQGFPDLLSRLTDGADVDDVMPIVRRDYQNPAYAKKELPGAFDKIAELREAGYKTALITNATRAIFNQDCDDFSIDPGDYFSFVQTVDDLEHVKPDARVFTPLLRQLGIISSELVYIGDEIKDAVAAQNAHAHFIGVETGMASAEDFKRLNAKYITSIKEISLNGTV